MSLIPEFALGIANAWWFLIVYMIIMAGQLQFYPNKKEIMKRLTTHPETENQRWVGRFNRILYFGSMIYAVFLPLKIGTIWFWAGLALFVIAMTLYAIATHNYATTPFDQPVTKGVYSISRNPLHFFSLIAWFGVAVATLSWVMMVSVALQMVGTHIMTLQEERFCLEKYGDSYREYMEKVPQYFLFF